MQTSKFELKRDERISIVLGLRYWDQSNLYNVNSINLCESAELNEISKNTILLNIQLFMLTIASAFVL